jgi:isoleucyl-tRNA synthetase
VSTELTPALVAEGLVREVVHAVQSHRKSLDLEFTDRIELVFATESPDLRAAIEAHLDYVAAETLATRVSFGGHDGPIIDVDGHGLGISLQVTHGAGGAAVDAGGRS